MEKPRFDWLDFFFLIFFSVCFFVIALVGRISFSMLLDLVFTLCGRTPKVWNPSKKLFVFFFFYSNFF